MSQSFIRCTCSSTRRFYATAAPLKAAKATVPEAEPAVAHTLPKSRIVAGIILSRPPLLLPPLSDFEKSYYSYSRKINRALSDDFERERYFRAGSQAEGNFLDHEERLNASQALETEEVADYKNDASLTTLNRKLDRTLYLLLKKKRPAAQKKGEWQFPQGAVEESDSSLVQAAIRELQEECGPNMDIFLPSKVPASVYTYKPPSSHPHSKAFDQTQVFFVPARILRGQATITAQAKKEKITEFAWCTKEEVQSKVDAEYWDQALKQGHLLTA